MREAARVPNPLRVATTHAAVVRSSIAARDVGPKWFPCTFSGDRVLAVFSHKFHRPPNLKTQKAVTKA